MIAVYNYIEYVSNVCDTHPVAFQCVSTLTLNQLEPVKQQIRIALLTRIRKRYRERQICTAGITTVRKWDYMLRII